jgi:hypothetical protein
MIDIPHGKSIVPFRENTKSWSGSIIPKILPSMNSRIRIVWKDQKILRREYIEKVDAPQYIRINIIRRCLIRGFSRTLIKKKTPTEEDRSRIAQVVCLSNCHEIRFSISCNSFLIWVMITYWWWRTVQAKKIEKIVKQENRSPIIDPFFNPATQ